MQSIPVDAGLALLVAPCLVSLAAYGLAWSLAIGWLAANAVRRRGRDDPRPPAGAPATGLTILKPLCGIDEELEANLASFFELEHEPLQLVFGAASPDDPSLAIARRLARKHPGRDVTIVAAADPAVPNPKIGLMESLLPHARHGIVLLSDSNVRVTTDEARRVLPDFADPTVGMVYQPVVAVGERTVPAAVENLHYTEYAAFLTIGARILAGQHTVNAKGQWVRREALAAVGDFTGVRDCGADDYALAELVRRAGWGLRPATAMVHVVQRHWSWKSFALRNLRHAGLRWRICPWAYPLELLFNPIPWTLPLLAAGRLDLAAVAAAVVAAKLLLELSATRLLRGVELAWRFVPVIPLKDIVIFGCWFIALFARTATWRDRTYRLCPGGRIEPLLPVPAVGPAPALKSAA
jgi:ceramide glucosyltransferase